MGFEKMEAVWVLFSGRPKKLFFHWYDSDSNFIFLAKTRRDCAYFRKCVLWTGKVFKTKEEALASVNV